VRVLKTVSPNTDTRKYRPIPNTGIVRTLVQLYGKTHAWVFHGQKLTYLLCQLPDLCQLGRCVRAWFIAVLRT